VIEAIEELSCTCCFDRSLILILTVPGVCAFGMTAIKGCVMYQGVDWTDFVILEKRT
jgi:hypothetical protein